MRRAAPWIVISLLLAIICGFLLNIIRYQAVASDAEAARAAREFAAFKAESRRADSDHFAMFMQYVEANDLLLKENRALADQALKHPARKFSDF